jgi:hypothetical protein
MTRGLRLALLISLLVIAPQAFADSITYVVTPAGGGPTLLTWTMEQNPVASDFGSGFSVTTSCGTMGFFTAPDGGGFSSIDCGEWDLYGAQMFSGSTTLPTMLPGTFALDDFFGENHYDVTGTANNVPEPASMVLLGTGLVGAFSRIRKKLA